MKLLSKKLNIEISVKGKHCNNCFWADTKTSNSLYCILFDYKKLKGSWEKDWKRCKKCLHKFKHAKEV